MCPEDNPVIVARLELTVMHRMALLLGIRLRCNVVQGLET